ncbi:hypothetical protein BaRGS_00022969, partial [Batillaria attramentaria]
MQISHCTLQQKAEIEIANPEDGRQAVCTWPGNLHNAGCANPIRFMLIRLIPKKERKTRKQSELNEFMEIDKCG